MRNNDVIREKEVRHRSSGENNNRTTRRKRKNRNTTPLLSSKDSRLGVEITLRWRCISQTGCKEDMKVMGWRVGDWTIGLGTDCCGLTSSASPRSLLVLVRTCINDIRGSQNDLPLLDWHVLLSIKSVFPLTIQNEMPFLPTSSAS